jgi:hypothetical protein
MQDRSDYHGIDILVQRGASLAAILAALQDVCGLSQQDVILPGQETQPLGARNHPLRARIFTLDGGDFSHKIDLDGPSHCDFPKMARALGQALQKGVVIPDETTIAAGASFLLRHGFADEFGSLDDEVSVGLVFVSRGEAK